MLANNLSQLTVASVMLGAAISIAPMSAEAGAAPALFEPTSESELSAEASRGRTLSSLYELAGPGQVRFARIALLDLDGAEDLTFTLSRGPVATGRVTLTRNRVERRGPQDFTWFGDGPAPEIGAVLVARDGQLTGVVDVHLDRYLIEPLGGGVHAIAKVDPRRLPADHPSGWQSALPVPDTSPAGTFPDASATGAKEDPSILAPVGTTSKVLVAYTAAARSGAGDIAALIQAAIDQANQAYASSATSPRLALVTSFEVSYTESGNIETDRNRLVVPSDGYMDNVHGLRDVYSADVAILLVENGGGYCGVATQILANQANGFAVVARNCATANLSFAHEIGHLQGARHDPGADSATEPFPYGHGKVHQDLLGDGWHTIMAYRKCGLLCTTRIARFSNPDVIYNGVATGDASTRDNARVLDESAGLLAGFRVVASVGSTGIFDRAPGNTYRPATSMVRAPACFTSARLTGQGHNDDRDGYARVMDVKVNGNTHRVLSWIDDGETLSFDVPIPASQLVRSGQNDIQAFITWSDDGYDNGHWVTLNLGLTNSEYCGNGYCGCGETASNCRADCCLIYGPCVE